MKSNDNEPNPPDARDARDAHDAHDARDAPDPRDAATPTRKGVGRRRLMKAAVGGGILAVLASGVALVRSSGYDVPEPARSKLIALEPWQYIVVQHLARRICAADADGVVSGVVSADETDVVGFVDAYVAKMSKKLRRDLMRFFAFVEQLAPAMLGMTSRFTHLASSDQDRVLASLESNASDLLRGGFEGVKALVFMGYYRDPRTWTVLGYDGPRVGRGVPLE